MQNSTSPVNDIDLDTIPERLSGADRLRMIYSRPGPYATVYLATRPLLPELAQDDADASRRWERLRRELREQGAPENVLDAIGARLALPGPEDAAAIGIIAASDGTTVVDYGQEPPHHDVATFDTLPQAAPMLEWYQRRIPHLVVTIDERGADVATFGPDRFTRLDSLEGGPEAMAEPIAQLVDATDARLIVVSGDGPLARGMADSLTNRVPISCRVVAEPEVTDVDDLADVTVRHVSDTAARTTVGLLRELRYLASHRSAVDGTADTVASLRRRNADVLLIHDDPNDQRRIWIGSEPHQLSLEARADHAQHARLVDAAIRAAVTNDTTVHIIPTTAETGPDDDTAALHRHSPPL